MSNTISKKRQSEIKRLVKSIESELSRIDELAHGDAVIVSSIFVSDDNDVIAMPYHQFGDDETCIEFANMNVINALSIFNEHRLEARKQELQKGVDETERMLFDLTYEQRQVAKSN